MGNPGANHLSVATRCLHSLALSMCPVAAFTIFYFLNTHEAFTMCPACPIRAWRSAGASTISRGGISVQTFRPPALTLKEDTASIPRAPPPMAPSTLLQPPSSELLTRTPD